MIILTLIFALIGIIEIIIALWSDFDNNETNVVMFSSGITLVITTFIYFIFIAYERETKIEPIEVYRGNTKLQITYQDSIPIDSVVVYKNK